MFLAVILFAGFVGIAVFAILAVLAFLDVAFNVSDSIDRARRDAKYAVQPESVESSSRANLAIHQWAQSA
jgi:hypothetical protein